MKDSIIKRLELIYPKIILEVEELKQEIDVDYEVFFPYKISWYDFIEILNKNGLDIKNLKD